MVTSRANGSLHCHCHPGLCALHYETFALTLVLHTQSTQAAFEEEEDNEQWLERIIELTRVTKVRVLLCVHF